MAKPKLVSETRIYTDIRLLISEIIDVTPSFPRDYKYSIGSKLHELCIILAREVSAAYMNKDIDVRIYHLTEFQVAFETLRLLIRTAGERRWIRGVSRHAHIIQLIESIGKQSTAWKNSLASVKEKSELQG